MNKSKQFYQVVAALIWRGNDLLLVRQRGPGDPHDIWALPGGVAEEGELLNEVLKRELKEETGLKLLDPGHLLYVVQHDNRALEQLHEDGEPGNGYLSTTFVFETDAWEGIISVTDPDGLVKEAAFVPRQEAIEKLKTLSARIMKEPIIAYLRGEANVGAMWFYRRWKDGKDELIFNLKTPS